MNWFVFFFQRYRKLYVFGGQRNKEYTPELISIDLDSRATTVMSTDEDCQNMPQRGYTQRATIDSEKDEIYVLTVNELTIFVRTSLVDDNSVLVSRV